MTETPGQRLYLIRLACGDGIRTPEPLKAFAARVKAKTGATYHANALSLLERNEQNWKLEDVNHLSAVDPLRRGPVWLAALNAAAEDQPELPDPSKDRKLTEQEIARAIRQADLEDRESAASEQPKKRRGGSQRS